MEYNSDLCLEELYVSLYSVEYSLTICVEAADSIEAVEKANEVANLNDAYIYVDGNAFN